MPRDEGPTRGEIDAMLKKLEQRIDTLKKRYERYFLGIDRRPPQAMRRQVTREVFELEQAFISNTAQKFKLRSLVQQFNTNKTRWNRIMRQIEKGTYHRDQNRAQRRQQQRESASERAKEEEKDEAFELNPEEDFIEDIQDIDMEEVFNEPQQPQPQNQPRQPQQPQQPKQPRQPSSADKPAANTPDQRTAAEKERIKQKRLAEIQAKLGMSSDQPPSNQPSSAPPSNPGKSNSTGGSDRSPPSNNNSKSTSSSDSGSARNKKLQKLRRKLKQEKNQ